MSGKKEEEAPRRRAGAGKAKDSGKGELIKLDFEVFGKVQRVYFRKHTKKAALALGLVGWVMNTSDGTVIGQAFGDAKSIERMKVWLSTKGSPKSVIKEAKFENEGPVPSCRFKRFTIRRP